MTGVRGYTIAVGLLAVAVLAGPAHCIPGCSDAGYGEVWRFPLLDNGGDRLIAPAGDKLYVTCASFDGGPSGIWAIDAASGSAVWYYEIDVPTALCATDAALFCVVGGAVHCVAADTALTQWVATPGAPDAIAAAGDVVVTRQGSSTSVLDQGTGVVLSRDIVWPEDEVPADVTDGPWVIEGAKGPVVCYRTDDNGIVAVEPRYQEVVWESPIEDEIVSVTLLPDGLLLVTADEMSKLRGRDGRSVWSVPLEEELLCEPVASPDGQAFYTLGESGLLSAIKSGTGREITSVDPETWEGSVATETRCAEMQPFEKLLFVSPDGVWVTAPSPTNASACCVFAPDLESAALLDATPASWCEVGVLFEGPDEVRPDAGAWMVARKAGWVPDPSVRPACYSHLIPLLTDALARTGLTERLVVARDMIATGGGVPSFHVLGYDQPVDWDPIEACAGKPPVKSAAEFLRTIAQPVPDDPQSALPTTLLRSDLAVLVDQIVWCMETGGPGLESLKPAFEPLGRKAGLPAGVPADASAEIGRVLRLGLMPSEPAVRPTSDKGWDGLVTVAELETVLGQF